MSTTLIRAISVAGLGAIAGAACIALAFLQRLRRLSAGIHSARRIVRLDG
jgi:hypothetical protein